MLQYWQKMFMRIFSVTAQWTVFLYCRNNNNNNNNIKIATILKRMSKKKE